MAKQTVSILHWLDGAADAARRARHDPGDAEALHDFRINVRRAIVHVKIDGRPREVPAKLRKRLRRALRVTGPWRDAHIESIWMKHYARRRSSGPGAASLERALAQVRAQAPADPRWWREVDRTLMKARRAFENGISTKSDLRAARLKAAEKEWRRLARRLRRLNEVSDKRALHKARIAVKKLRYILEALGKAPRGLPTPAALRGLQSVLGDVHDHDVIAGDIAAAGRTQAIAAPAGSALARLARERRRLMIGAARGWNLVLGSTH
ncbi:MAG: CHAD domain-containing protein [Elusimicrobiota bacterium]